MPRIWSTILAQNPLGDTTKLGLPRVSADQGTLTNLLNGLFMIIGAVAVIFIVVGGLQYVTSSGNPDRAAKAKNTILYAIIGLIVAVFATAIVNFVLGRI